jgi:hypothetical protein
MFLFNYVFKTGLIAGMLLQVFISAPALSESNAEELGRLFTDVEQRKKLDAIRRGTYSQDTEQQGTASKVRVNGVVVRSDGENVVWINGESTIKSDTVKGVRVNTEEADSKTLAVPLSIDGRRIKIKPGQSWSGSTTTVKDNY